MATTTTTNPLKFRDNTQPTTTKRGYSELVSSDVAAAGNGIADQLSTGSGNRKK